MGMDFDDDDSFYLDGSAGVAVSDQERVDAAADGKVVYVAKAKETTPIYFDLETVPDESRLDSFGLDPVPPVPEAIPFGQLPDPPTIVAGTADDVKARLAEIGFANSAWLAMVSIAERAGKNRKGVHDEIKKAHQFRDEAIGAHDDRIKLLSTTPEYCKICAIGVAIGNEEVRSFVINDRNPVANKDVHEISERDIILSFWNRITSCSPLIGFNIASFDIPVILARSAILGIQPSRQLDLSPWGSDVCDLYLKRFGPRGNTSRERPGKLKELCRLYGISVPAGDCDGSQVFELMKTPEGRVKCGEYVRSDVHVLREFHRKLAGYFWA
jgi:hypothetical protein